jgi:hypothetical protein
MSGPWEEVDVGGRAEDVESDKVPGDKKHELLTLKMNGTLLLFVTRRPFLVGFGRFGRVRGRGAGSRRLGVSYRSRRGRRGARPRRSAPRALGEHGTRDRLFDESRLAPPGRALEQQGGNSGPDGGASTGTSRHPNLPTARGRTAKATTSRTRLVFSHQHGSVSSKRARLGRSAALRLHRSRLPRRAVLSFFFDDADEERGPL